MEIISIFKPTVRKVVATVILLIASIIIFTFLSFSGYGHVPEWLRLFTKFIEYIFLPNFSISHLLETVFRVSSETNAIISIIIYTLALYIWISILSAIFNLNSSKKIYPIIASAIICMIIHIIVSTTVPNIVSKIENRRSNDYRQARSIKTEVDCISTGFIWKIQTYNTGETLGYCTSEK